MRQDKHKAISFRQQGRSYNWIRAKLGIPKGTLSYWFRDLELSNEAKSNLYQQGKKKSIAALIIRNKDQTRLAKERADKIREKAIAEVGRLLRNPLFITGVALYWAEGYKRGATGSKWKCVDFTNADPKMVIVMMRFFREICKVEEKDFRAQLIAHQNVQVDTALRFWSKVTQVSLKQFIKTSVPTKKRSTQAKRRKSNILPMGTLHVRVYDVQLFFRMIGWIEGIQIHFSKSEGP